MRDKWQVVNETDVTFNNNTFEGEEKRNIELSILLLKENLAFRDDDWFFPEFESVYWLLRFGKPVAGLNSR